SGRIEQTEEGIGALQIVQVVAYARFRCPPRSTRGEAGHSALGGIEEQTVVRAAYENRRDKLIRAAPAVSQRQPAGVRDHDVALHIDVIVGMAARSGGEVSSGCSVGCRWLIGERFDIERQRV